MVKGGRGGYGQGPRTYRFFTAVTETLMRVATATGAILLQWLSIFAMYVAIWLIGWVGVILVGLWVGWTLARAIQETGWMGEASSSAEIAITAAIVAVVAGIATFYSDQFYVFIMDVPENWKYLAAVFLIPVVLEYRQAYRALQIETADPFAFGETQLREADDYNLPPHLVRRVERARREKARWRGSRGSSSSSLSPPDLD